MTSETLLPWPHIASFVRLHTHDVRNSLSSLDLEAAFLSEVMEGDDEAKDSLKRLRSQIHGIANDLKELSAKMSDPKVMRASIAAKDIFLIWSDIPGTLENLIDVEWSDFLGGEKIEVDPITLTKVFTELFRNAQLFDSKKLVASARVEAGHVIYELRELKKDDVSPQEWGRTPFLSSRRGGYGLGLWQAHRIIEVNGGKFTQSYDTVSHELISAIQFPVA